MYTKAKVWALSACIAAVLFCSLGAVAHAQVSPVGTFWDLRVTGFAVVGSGYIEFFDDGTLFGYMIIRPNPGIKPAQRPASVNIGLFVVTGDWGFDAKGRVVGFFNGAGEEIPLDITSFSAVVTAPPRAKISMVAFGNNGKMTFVGFPEVPLTDLTGSSWTAQVLKSLVKSTEFFDLLGIFFACLDKPLPTFPALCVNPVALPNVYALEGNGGSYDLEGSLMLNAGGRVSLRLEELAIDHDTGEVQDPGAGNVRSVTGTLNLTRRTATMAGTDEDKAVVRMTNTFVP